MRIGLAVAMALAALALPAIAAEEALACPNDATTMGMHARMKVLKDQMNRIEWATDRAEQRRLVDLNMKHVQEGLRELRKRKLAVGCQLEMMDTMLEAVVRHQQLAQETSGR